MKNENPHIESTTQSGLENLTDSLQTAITGIPAPVRKNFVKAFSQLCTAAVDIPVAFLEGKASEIRALNEARVQIIKKEGLTISEEIQVPQAYISKASSKYASKIIREQINLDQITLIAAKELSTENTITETNSVSEIDEDWLNEFENQARLKSSDDMKLIFGKILSGEIAKAGSFSIRTIKLISQLDSETAKLFQLFCSICIAVRFGNNLLDARVISFDGDAASNTLHKFGLSFYDLNVLQEYGLIISDYNSYIGLTQCISTGNGSVLSLSYNNKHYGLIPIDIEKYDKKLRANGVALTKSGRELLDIIPKVENVSYNDALIDYFKKKHLEMIEIKERAGTHI